MENVGQGTLRKIKNSENMVGKRLAGFSTSYAGWFYVLAWAIVFCVGLAIFITTLVQSWSRNGTIPPVDVQMTIATDFATQWSGNEIVAQLAVNVDHSFSMYWYWFSFSLAWFAVIIFAPIVLVMYYGLMAVSESTGNTYLGRLSDNFLYGQLYIRGFDPLKHAILIPIDLALWLSVWWYVFTGRTWIGIVSFAFGVIMLRMMHVATEYCNRTGPSYSGNNKYSWQQSNQGFLMFLWALCLAFIVVISSVYLWKYPNASRQAYITVSYFFLIGFEVVLWVMSLIHYESTRYKAVQTSLRIVLHILFWIPITISIYLRGKKGNPTERDDLLASSIVSSGTTMILTAFLTVLIFFMQARIAPLDAYYPIFHFPADIF